MRLHHMIPSAIAASAMCFATATCLFGNDDRITEEDACLTAGQQLIGSQYRAPARAPVQREAAIGLIRRLLGDAAASFEVEMIAQEGGYDVFEVESVADSIVLRGLNGVTGIRQSICRKTPRSPQGRDTSITSR